MVFYGIIMFTLIAAGLVTVRRIMGFYKGLPGILLPILCAGTGLLMALNALFAIGALPAQRQVEATVGSFEIVRYSNWFITPFDTLEVERVEI